MVDSKMADNASCWIHLRKCYEQQSARYALRFVIRVARLCVKQPIGQWFGRSYKHITVVHASAPVTHRNGHVTTATHVRAQRYYKCGGRQGAGWHVKEGSF